MNLSIILFLVLKIFDSFAIDFLVLQHKSENIAVIFQCKTYKKDANLDQAFKDFYYSAFDFKNVLEFAFLNNLPVILILDDNFEGKSTTCQQAPWTESARVALTWASYYFRFKQLNVHVIKMPFQAKIDLHQYKYKFYSLISKKYETNNKTPEELMQQRVISLNDFNQINDLVYDISIEKININKKPSKTNYLKFELLELKNNQKRFLISGAAGFIGINLVKKLLDFGHQVIGIDNFLCSSKNNLNEIKNNPNFFFANLDICIPLEVEGHIDEVIHLASVPSPEFYYNLPQETLSTGLYGTKNMLEIALNKRAGFLFSSTSEVYGDPSISPQPETYEGNVNTIGKRSQYDQSKRGGETLCMLYFKKYNFDIRIARIFNTYGPYMQLNDGRVITNFIDGILNNKSLTIYGDGNQTRSFCYVSDNIDGLIKLLGIKNQKSIENYIFNIGNNNEMTINELALEINKVAKKLINKESKIEHIKPIDTTDPKQRCPDLNKSNKVINFYPKINLEKGLELTLKYFILI